MLSFFKCFFSIFWQITHKDFIIIALISPISEVF